MKTILSGLAVISLLTSAALADAWKDESGKHRGKYDHGDAYAEYDRELKEEFWVGNCKIERKWEDDGSYKEERECKGNWD